MEQPGTPPTTSRKFGTILVQFYMMLGTILYYIVYQLEQLIVDLVNDFGIPLLAEFTAQKWHVRSLAITMTWPIVVLVLLIRDGLLLVYAVVMVVALIIGRLLKTGFDEAVESQSWLKRIRAYLQIVWYDTVKSRTDGPPISSQDVAAWQQTFDTSSRGLKQTLSKTGSRIGSLLDDAGNQVNQGFKDAWQSLSRIVGDATTRVGNIAGRTSQTADDMMPPPEAFDPLSHSATIENNISEDNSTRFLGDDTATIAVEAPEEIASKETTPDRQAIFSQPEAAESEESEAPTESAVLEQPSQPTINVNTANADALTTLPGIGPALAKRIIAHREEHGRFSDLESLTAVNGIGQNLIDQLDGLVTFD